MLNLMECPWPSWRFTPQRWVRSFTQKRTSTTTIGASPFWYWFQLSIHFKDLPLVSCTLLQHRKRKCMIHIIAFGIQSLISRMKIIYSWLEILLLLYMLSWCCSQDQLQTFLIGKCSCAVLASAGVHACIWVPLPPTSINYTFSDWSCLSSLHSQDLAPIHWLQTGFLLRIELWHTPCTLSVSSLEDHWPHLMSTLLIG